MPSATDIVKWHYEPLCENKNVRSVLEAFKRGDKRLDELFHNILDVSSAIAALKTFICLTIFYGNAAMERGFLLIKNVWSKIFLKNHW